MTIQYPEEKTSVYPRFRGRHKLHRFEDTGLEKCVGCSLCAAACPADCIRVVAAENDPADRVSAGERYAAVYEINLARCISAATARSPAPSTRSRWATSTSCRLSPRGPDLHQGDAAGGADRANAAAPRGRVSLRPWLGRSNSETARGGVSRLRHRGDSRVPHPGCRDPPAGPSSRARATSGRPGFARWSPT